MINIYMPNLDKNLQTIMYKSEKKNPIWIWIWIHRPAGHVGSVEGGARVAPVLGVVDVVEEVVAVGEGRLAPRPDQVVDFSVGACRAHSLSGQNARKLTHSFLTAKQLFPGFLKHFSMLFFNWIFKTWTWLPCPTFAGVSHCMKRKKHFSLNKKKATKMTASDYSSEYMKTLGPP